ncbi:hypothetical protein DKX38_004867 [Salix brachista]|uniref:Morc S5 domain-containing protein n=1 Tax=Salix brachista TaxID=2182728 RepID=A0A5N5NDU0_9ROSI|nr:hypothetical protein DKX38_004867 [Salix brachista]
MGEALDKHTSNLHSDSLDNMDVDNSFLEQQVRSTAAKRSSNSLNDCDGHGHSFLNKKPKQESDLGFAVPDHGCLAPVPLRTVAPPLAYIDRQEGHVGFGKKNNNEDNLVAAVPAVQCCKQFWKAGDYEGGTVTDSSADHSVGMDHVRVHPKFLHSNATSHKWALGAFAELLDNAVDEVGHGATCVSIDVLNNNKYCSKMLLVEDNGGGMNPDRMRACMSLGYSAKSKIANTIGQYGNGFKTSTMRLGADVIVFSRCRGKDGKSVTQSVGLLSYTFLTATGKEDIVVPMIDFEKGGHGWNKKIRSSSNDWDMNLKTILQWSPFPFWRVWNAAGSDGRGVIGALEANFVEPAHDKQGFERTSVLSRLEAKLITLQKTYWRKNCHMIGYAVRRQSRNLSSDTEQSTCNKDMHSTLTNQNGQCFTDGNERSLHVNAIYQKGHGSESRHSRMKNGLNSCKISDVNDASEGVNHTAPLASRESLLDPIKHKSTHLLTSPSYSKPVIISENGQITTNGNVKTLSNSKAEDRESRICRTENHLLQYERDRSRKFESQLQERTTELEAERKKTELLQKEFECLVVMIQEERTRQTEREDELRKKIKAIEDLKERVRQLEGKELLGCKIEKNCY